MKKLSFPTVKLGNFIREVKEKVKNSDLSQDDFTVYGVTNIGGITVTNNKASDDLSNYTVLRENQFAYNPYRVNVGSIGLSAPGTFGAVSPAYVVFETDGQINNEFLLYYLKSSLGINLIKWYGDRGGVRSALRFSDLKKIDFPDITLEQQNKLLIKIKRLDKLLCDMNKNLSVDNIAALRQSILQQAVEGKLCEQDPNDEPASVLLEKIKAEKERLIAEKKIKKQKTLPPISEEEKPFDLPKGWEWCRLGDILIVNEYGTSQKADSSKTIPVLRMNNIAANGEMCYTNLKYVDSDIKDLPKLYLQKGDLLFNRTNSYELVGKTGLFEENGKYTFASYLIRLRPYGTENAYLHKCMNAKYYRTTQIEPHIVQQNGQANYNGTKVSATLIPLAPVNEQRRIVSKVDNLMRLCSALEKEISKAQNYASQLMEAVLQEAFSIKETEKAAQVIECHPDHKAAEIELLVAARGNIREDTWEHLRKRALEIAGEES